MKVPEEAMPSLFLTREEELDVERETDELVRDTADAFDAFVAHGRGFPKHLWKKVRVKEGLRVYRTRRSYSSVLPHACVATSSVTDALMRTVSSSYRSDSTSSGTSSRDTSGAASVALPLTSRILNTMQQFPAVVLTGVIPGTLEDVAYGNISDNEEIWRLRSSYTNDEQRDCKILATLKHATSESPFEFFGIKWAWRKLPTFLQQRDMVFAEKTDVVRNAQGDIEMGFTLMHSVQLPGIPELSKYNILRMKVSLCFLARRHNDHMIEIYCRGFQIPVGDVPTTIAISLYADSLLATLNVVECANMKKLMWLTRHRQRQRRAASGRHARDTESGLANLESATHCQGCERTLKRFGGLNRSANLCRCCQRVVCGKCSSERKIVLDVADDGAVTQRALLFCLSCVLEARALPALDIARATAVNWSEN